MTQTQRKPPRQSSYMLRFAKAGGRLIAFSRIRVYKGGKGKRPLVRLFNANGPLADLSPEAFQDAVLDSRIQCLDLPHDLQEKAEHLSEKIGELYTPQEALRIFQRMIQEHPTTLSAEVVHPLDRDPARAPDRPADESGTACGFAYQAWLIDDGMRPAFKKAWIWRLSDGKRVDGRYLRSCHGSERTRIVPYHTALPEANIEEKLLRMHVRHMEAEPPVPVTLRQCSDVHDLMREKRVGPWKNEICENDVEAERAGGRTMHRLK